MKSRSKNAREAQSTKTGGHVFTYHLINVFSCTRLVLATLTCFMPDIAEPTLMCLSPRVQQVL
uniref:Putative ovule protein n=1 Tax=Solanum chacoense TaxID=4108 RepID=A0A0V0GFU4_SOLCH